MALSNNARLAKLIGYLDPRAWDFIIPHGPLVYVHQHAFGPQPEPWRASHFDRVALNPQPLPPKTLYALALADATIAQAFALRAGPSGSESGQRRVLTAISEFVELCPRWPRWPKHWPPPPPPPWQQDEMTASELFFAGSRFLLAAEMMDDAALKQSLERAGEKVMEMGLEMAG
jgi:hypothetical protein